MSVGKKYTDAEKAAYYKKLAAASKAAPRTRAAAPAKKRAVTVRAKAPVRRTVSGFGDYSTKKKNQSTGARIGGHVGSKIGTFLGGLASKLMGFGDYHIEQNSLFMGGAMKPPEIVNSVHNGEVIVRHREYLGDVSATVAFTLTPYYLNPGLQASFPWLSTMAAAFEEYKWRGMVFEYISTSSDAILSSATSSSLGSVNMATQYNSIEGLFPDKAAMLNHEFGNSTKPSCDLLHPIECLNSRTPVSQLYVRTGPVPAGADERLYDLGVFQIATSDQQASTLNGLGQLWCSYEIGLFKPRLPSEDNFPSRVLSDHFQLAAFTNSFPLGTQTTPTSTSSLQGTIVASNRYIFPPRIVDGNYLVVINWRGATPVTAGYPTITGVNGSTIPNLWLGNTAASATSPISGTVTITQMMMSFIVNVNGVGGGFNLGVAVLPGTPTPCDMYITQIDSDLINLKVPKNMLKLTADEITTDDCSDEDFVRVSKNDLNKLLNQ
ncbi:capsid protein [Crucivirus-275]|nr:capsid protein [Crucivirus-275]